MTGMEQNLRYIEREIRFMVKDQYGNSTYAKYADRVIEDACGIPNFCSTVLSSKRPLTAILRAVRGPRGDVIVRFFNVSLHDARIEMVMVLAEVAKLRMHNNRKSRNAHDYFMKLYRKANKRMIRLITGSKNKESFKSMYRGLRDFAKMDDFDYDEDDDDAIDEYFDSVGEFGDTDYAQACLDAYRDGKTPPEFDLSDHIGGTNVQLMGNEEILKEIATIEAKLGRHLTDAELDRLLCGDDDDDDDLYPNINSVKKSSDDMIDSIVDVICDRLVEKLGLTNVGSADNKNYESLDEFIDRENSRTAVNSTEVGSTHTAIAPNNNIPNNPSTEALIGIRNRLKNDVQVDSGIVEHADALHPDDTNESDTDESNSLPPSEKLGGNYNEADLIDVGLSDDSLDEYEDGDTMETSDYESTTEGLVAAEGDCNPHIQHQLMLGDIINDCKLAPAIITTDFELRLQTYFSRLDIEINNLFISLAPSNVDDKLFTLIVTIRINGDYEIINMMHINTVVLMYIKKIAERFGIDENLIDTELNIVDSSSTFDMDLKALNTLNKNFTSHTIYNLYSALSVIAAYTYQRINKFIDVRFVNDPRSNKIDIYFFSKSDELLDAEFEEFYQVELDGEGILNEIFDSFNIDCDVIYHLIRNDEDYEEFFENVRETVGYQVKKTSLVNNYLRSNEEFIQQQISSNDINVDSVYSNTDISTGRKNVIIDNLYGIYTNPILNQSQKDDLESSLAITGDYGVNLENVLRAISMNIEVSNFIEYFKSDTEDQIAEEIDDTPKTSNFGI